MLQTALYSRVTPENTLDVFGVKSHLLLAQHNFGMLDYVSHPGHEPPPHVHSKEDEMFYVLEGSLEAFCGKQVIQIEAGGLLFLPRGIPHAWIIRSPRFHALLMVQPGGFEDVFRALGTATAVSQPADTSISYAESLQTSTYLDDILGGFGVHYLSPAEIAEQMPDFPMPPEMKEAVVKPVSSGKEG